ncbi:aspartate aminotransferase family protein [Promicromonospora panici]|uniref:aminotransferase family protein n=1 Tax=Promicromonospora panici TaxID=2219658 RepID=UPI00101C2A79|nr:aminotransferase class III-fold pyridoxal phosphate-dependent enzyme [Promicromonospora panici]
MTRRQLGDALWNPQAHMPTAQAKRLVLRGGVGAWLISSTGQRLLDATASLWHANIGHGRARLADVAYRQMRKLETYHTFGRFANEPALRLADRLAEIGPVPDAKVMLTSGGSDSVDLACKLARRHWQLEDRPEKRMILSRVGAYHGLHAYGTSVAGLQYNRDGYGTPSLVPDTARVATNDIAAVRRSVAELGPENIAAIIAEPVIGTGGVIGPAEGYLQGLQDLCRSHDILLIADEVITGFGRTGHLFASHRWDIQPDMVTMAKGITSGYAPLGGVLVSPRISERFFEGADAPIFRHGLTYSGHATACAVALANLDVIDQEGLVDQAGRLETVLEKAVKPLGDHQLVEEVRAGAGFMAGIHLHEGVNGDAIAEACTDAGVLIRVIHDNTLQICPPFVTTEDEVGLIAGTIAQALDAYQH